MAFVFRKYNRLRHHGTFLLMMASIIVLHSCTKDAPAQPPSVYDPTLQVSIVAPKDSSLIDDAITIVISAEDDKKVAFVELFINGIFTARFDSLPYRYVLFIDTLNEGSDFLIMAKALDGDGHEAVSKTVTVTVHKGTTFSKLIGGTKKVFGSAVQVTNDGGYIIGGYCFAPDGVYQDMYLAKTDQNGNVEWEKTIGGAKNDRCNAMIQSHDGGFVIVGSTNSFGGGDYDIYVVRTDGAGNTIWERTLGDAQYEYGSSIIQSPDGGYIIAGDSNTGPYGRIDMYIVKLSITGDILWQRWFGGTHDDFPGGLQNCKEGGFIVAGSSVTRNTGSFDFSLTKLDDMGEMEWENYFGSTSHEFAHAVTQTSDGGYIIGGYIDKIDVDWDMYVIKTDRNGKAEWERTFGDISVNIANSVLQTTDLGFVLAGYTTNPITHKRSAALVKIDPYGSVLWTRFLQFKSISYGSSVQHTADSGFIVTGYAAGIDGGPMNALLVKTNHKGIVFGSK